MQVFKIFKINYVNILPMLLYGSANLKPGGAIVVKKQNNNSILSSY